jgi:ligand-binding sensor domain-containing protein/two-component sensor histidine kinase
MGPFMAYGPETRHFAALNYSVYQSKNDYLWFGTSNGLVRFDGKRYKNFFSDHSNPNSPSGNIIVNFTEDKNNNLWMTDFVNGVTQYNPVTGIFKKYPRLSKDNFVYYGVNNVLCDDDKELWFATAGRGLAKYDYAKDTFDLFYPEPDKSKDGSVRGDNYLTDICQDRNDKNILWCTAFHGLFSFNKKTKQFIKYESGLRNSEGGEILFNDAETDEGGVLWLGSFGKGLIKFNTITRKFMPFINKQIPVWINDIKKINDSILYLACFSEGLVKYNTINKQVENITPTNYSKVQENTDPGIQRISVTKDAGIFIGGKYYFYQQHPAFVRLKTNILFSDNRNTKQEIFLTGFVWDEYRKKYWITTAYGNGVYELAQDKKNATPVPFLEAQKSDYIKIFEDIIVDAQKRLWVVRRNHGLYQYSDELRMFIKPLVNQPVPDSLTDHVSHLATDKKGNVWAFAKNPARTTDGFQSGGYFIYHDVVQGTSELYMLQWDTQFMGQKKLGSIQFKAGLEDNVFLFTQNGIFCCSRDTKKVTHIFKTGTEKKSLASAAIRVATINKYNDVWITNGGSLQVMHSSGFHVLANHDVDHGLPSMEVNDLNADSSGKIWANTSAGLAMFNPKAKYWRLYNRFDGMQKDYLDGSSFITTDNKIAIDQANGFILKDINEVAASTQPPFLRITSILINDSIYKMGTHPEQIQEISLPYSQNNISIEYAAMDWLYPLQTTYTYWVEGLLAFKTPTSSADARLNLNGLSPGKYVIHLKAINNSGVWSNEVVLAVIIKSPYWMTAWFIGLCILVIAGIMYAIYRYRINQLKKMQHMRNNISRDLHDDIGASLSNINILNELAKRNAGNPEKSKEYLAKSEEDIQRISESLSDIVWNINPRYDNLQNLFIRMKRYAGDMMDGKDISYDLEFPEDADKITLTMEKRRDFYLIFKEAVNNLVKYSKATYVNVTVKADRKTISLVIKDNGVGFDNSKVQYGNGLNNMKQRAAACNAILEIISKGGAGTEIKLVMHTT